MTLMFLCFLNLKLDDSLKSGLEKMSLQNQNTQLTNNEGLEY